MNLLKTHEEILERLTEIASKENKFEERSQFINIQKMIKEELTIIEKLKESEICDKNKLICKIKSQLQDIKNQLIGKPCVMGKSLEEKESVLIDGLYKLAYSKDEPDLKQNDIDAYKLGVGKLLIGQRGSGVSSTLIDECIKYKRPLLFKTQKQADLFKTRNPSLRAYCYDTEKETEYYNEEVCVELLLYDCDSKLISEELDKIKHNVKSICTVGLSYHNKNNESEHFIHGVNMYK